MRQPGLRVRSTLPVNLQVVADAAGVHRSTASRALNPTTRHLVAQDVAQRIQTLARDLGYRADPIAVGLRTRRSRTVGIVLPDMANPVFGPILAGVEGALAAAGYSALIAYAGATEAQQIDVVDTLMGRRVDGIILATAQSDDPALSRCVDAGVPTVLVNRAEAKPRVSEVMSDDVGGLRLAVEHLLGLGHRRIGHLAGPQHLSTGRLRLQGFRTTMAAAGLESGLVAIAAAYTRSAGAAAAETLLDKKPTAIAAANDLLALGLYQALAARGLRCPDDVSITGHNDMPLVDMVDPPLTTVAIDHADLGREAGRLVIAAIERPDEPRIVHMAIPTLIVRRSTRSM
jgi:LacI family transcriptional regulator